MAGVNTDGTIEEWDLRTIRAYAEGAYARYASVSPINPHSVDTVAEAAWDRGVADAVAGTIDECVAPLPGAIPV